MRPRHYYAEGGIGYVFKRKVNSRVQPLPGEQVNCDCEATPPFDAKVVATSATSPRDQDDHIHAPALVRANQATPVLVLSQDDEQVSSANVGTSCRASPFPEIRLSLRVLRRRVVGR